MLVKHLLVSHHGAYEFGSPKLPQTVEAVILAFTGRSRRQDPSDPKLAGKRAGLEMDGISPGLRPEFFSRQFRQKMTDE